MRERTELMASREAPRRIQQGISVQQVGTETLVYDEGRHDGLLSEREFSSVIWKLANGERTVAQIGSEASIQLKTPVSEDLVLYAIGELRGDGLIEPSPTGHIGPAISRRAVLRRLGVGGAMLLPVVAAIVAPTAAQAYSGCFDCTSSQAVRTKRKQRAAKPAVTPPPSQQ
jgi:hypothetical protein